MKFLWKTINDFLEHRCLMLAGALAYYTIFALPPLLYLLLMVLTVSLSTVYEADAAESKAQDLLERQAAQMIGVESATEEIRSILQSNRETGGAWWKATLSFVGILVAATGVVAALQDSLNRVWSVKPDPQRAVIRDFLMKRMLSLAMILGLGFLLLVSLIISTILTALGDRLGDVIGMDATIARTINFVVQFLVSFVIFAAIFKFMPDAKVDWRDVSVGAGVTTVFFLLGRVALSTYLTYASPGVHLGSAAASLVVILLWVYYSSAILLLGAEITQVYACRFGGGIAPEEKAVRVVESIDRTRED